MLPKIIIHFIYDIKFSQTNLSQLTLMILHMSSCLMVRLRKMAGHTLPYKQFPKTTILEHANTKTLSIFLGRLRMHQNLKEKCARFEMVDCRQEQTLCNKHPSVQMMQPLETFEKLGC